MQEKVFWANFVGRIRHMPKASGRISEADRLIAKRVRRIRFANELTQTQFATALGISLDRLASIEYGRTPLTVGLADKISAKFNISIIWLATGEHRMTPCIGLITKQLDSIDGSEVLSVLFTPDFKHKIIADLKKSGDAMDNFISLLPEGPIEKQIEVAEYAVSSLLAQLEGAFSGLSIDGKEYLHDLIQRTFHGYLTDWDREQPGQKNEDAHKIRLTSITPKSNTGDVKSEIQKLIERVKSKASKQPGAKAELARTLGVAPARISEWLSGTKEPGGEYTLRLLKWVGQS
jgi:transcriptional regulator with XRE-family HTH domain